ncbi:MAG: hypothetical protein ACK55I_00640 [bacterium]
MPAVDDRCARVGRRSPQVGLTHSPHSETARASQLDSQRGCIGGNKVSAADTKRA